MGDGIAAERIFVIRSGIDPERFSAERGDHLRSEFNLGSDEKIVINVAHLAGHKGQKYLVQAIPHVLEKIPKSEKSTQVGFILDKAKPESYIRMS